MTLEELFQSYIYKKKLAGLSEATVWDYKHHLKGFFAFVGDSLPVSALTLEQVEAYVRSLLATKRLSRATVATYECTHFSELCRPSRLAVLFPV